MKKTDQFVTQLLDQSLTLRPSKIGPVFNSTAYICVCIYAGGPITGPIEEAFRSE